MKEVTCTWFEKFKGENDMLAKDISCLERRQCRWTKPDSIFCRLDSRVKIFGKFEDDYESRPFEINSRITTDILLDLLKEELKKREELLKVVQDSDIKCANCLNNNNCCRYNNYCCDADFCRDDCDKFDFSDEAAENVLHPKKEVKEKDLYKNLNNCYNNCTKTEDDLEKIFNKI